MTDPAPHLAVLAPPTLGAGVIMVRLGLDHGLLQLSKIQRRCPSRGPIGDESPLDPLDPVVAIEALRAGGRELILCEGGPTLLGELAAAGLVDELFLTLSPLLAGRSAAEQRLSLVEGTAFLPGSGIGCRLLTLRQAGSHLFLRYELPSPGQVGA
jgi:riboflavin biosynthesis pyrimidine reductase